MRGVWVMDINYYKKYEPIGNKWHITRELGRGSYGVVFEVERKDFSDAKSAMKILSIPSYPGEIDNFKKENYDLDETGVRNHFYAYVEEFVKEFQLMSKLRGHSNIVSYEDHDVIEKKDEVGWDIFIRMELLTPLGEYFSGKSPSVKDVIKLGMDMCEALDVCERNKIIHRDIKPTNIFVSSTGSFKLGDFGVARTLEKASCEMSKKGTYTYMAPEVFRGEEYDMTVDIYSLGIVMYKLLNDNMEPFRVDKVNTNDDTPLVRRMKGETLPKPKYADDDLARIILKACAFKASDRYACAKDMKRELTNLLDGRAEPAKAEIHAESSASEKSEMTVASHSSDKPSGTPYDVWCRSSNVLFKSIDTPVRWRCPRCDMANDSRDSACFVCGCLKSVYVKPATKKDSFATDLNDHHTVAPMINRSAVRPMDMKDINEGFRRRSDSKPVVYEEKSSKGWYIALITFLILMIGLALAILWPKLNVA